MNRELKFRMWDRNKKKMLFIDNLWTDFAEYGQDHIDQKINLHTLNIMQYTGLGNIYEGDILTTDNYPFIDVGKQNYVAVVEWLYAGFHRTLKCVNKNKVGISDGINEPLEDGKYYKVIGNIYENPELLELN